MLHNKCSSAENSIQFRTKVVGRMFTIMETVSLVAYTQWELLYYTPNSYCNLGSLI